MKPLFHPHLVNGPLGDPLLYIDMKFFGRAIMFDLGSCQSLPSRNLLRTEHVFVSHTHVDHFIGFDHLLRVLLGRPKLVNIYGPPNFIRQVAGKVSAYTWNLVENYPCSLEIQVHEISPEGIQKARLRSVTGFQVEPFGTPQPFRGLLHKEEAFQVRAVFLDHKIPTLAFALEENQHINILKTGLNYMGLCKGPWLKELKEAVWRKEGDDFEIEAWFIAGEGHRKALLPLGTLKEKILILSPGQKIVYVPDTIFSPQTEEAILGLAAQADSLFIETPFLEEDQERAREKHHLTAAQAGTLAAMAGVQRLFPFHISPKYSKNPDQVLEEAQSVFQNIVLQKKVSMEEGF
ncbi:MAG: MBL fold metallo-hydrolase [Thermodesulfobacteriota bacterium]